MNKLHIPSKIPSANKKALVCYIPDSYTLMPDHPNFVGHSNFQECRTLLDCLVNAGYACDVIGFQDNARFLIGANYDLLIAIRDQLEYGRDLIKPTGKVVMYSTACHWSFHNLAEYQRLNQLRIRRGISLKPRRQHNPINFDGQVDEVWYFGNSFQEQTYSYLPVSKYPITISTVSTSYPPKRKLTDENRRHFLWFGSVGSVHKGLDWLLDIFPRHPGLHLHICGLIEKEEDFFTAFHKELFGYPNIHFHGWVLPNSEKFLEITTRCGFIISPSCSEGCSGAVLQCMSAGLIPLISKANGINLKDNGYYLEDNIVALEKTLAIVSQESSQQLLELAISAQQYVRNHHTLTHYRASVSDRIKSLVTS